MEAELWYVTDVGMHIDCRCTYLICDLFDRTRFTAALGHKNVHIARECISTYLPLSLWVAIRQANCYRCSATMRQPLADNFTYSLKKIGRNPILLTAQTIAHITNERKNFVK